MHEPGAISRIFHEETKYIVGEMDKFNIVPSRSGPPVQFKDYHAEHPIDLIGYLPFANHPFTGEAMPQVPEPTGEWGLAELSRLLFFTNGISAILPFPDGTRHFFRCAPSAGALYPTEMYLCVRDLPDLADGVYSYLVKDHALVPVWEGEVWERLNTAAFGHGALAQSDVAIIFTGLWERSTWRYRERAYRRILLDTGHVLGNLNLVGPRYGFGVFPIGGFADGVLNAMLLLDDDQEGALAIAALPRLDTLDVGRVPPCAALPSGTFFGGAPAPSADLVRQLHRASAIAPGTPPERPETGTMAPKPSAGTGEIASLDHHDIPWEDGIEATILRRRSARSYLGTSIDLDALAAILSFSYQHAISATPADGVETAASPFHHAFDPSLLDTWVLALRVDGLDAGVHRYHPVRHQLELTRPGAIIEAAEHICLGQELGGNAAALVVHTADLDRAVRRYGDRAYRYLHLDAGQIGERINLAVQPLGLGASGIGGFYDNDVTLLLGIPETHAVAYITTIGQPASGR